MGKKLSFNKSGYLKYFVDFFISNDIEGFSGKPFIEFFQKTRDGKKGDYFIGT